MLIKTILLLLLYVFSIEIDSYLVYKNKFIEPHNKEIFVIGLIMLYLLEEV